MILYVERERDMIIKTNYFERGVGKSKEEKDVIRLGTISRKMKGNDKKKIDWLKKSKKTLDMLQEKVKTPIRIQLYSSILRNYRERTYDGLT